MKIRIRQSDTLWYYSKLLDVPLVLIEQSNRDLSSQNLSTGKVIHIPGFVLNQHVIEAEDTLWQLSSQYNLPMDTLLLVNQTIDPTKLTVGSSISIPYRVRDPLIQDVSAYTYEKMVNDIEKLATVYPFLVKKTVGKSVLGKSLPELQIGAGTKCVHANGSFHANEWITTPVLIQFINQYLLALTNNTQIHGMNMLPLFMETIFSMVPMVNPDGVDLVLNGVPAEKSFAEQVLEINNQSYDFSGWKANINGVDLNKQYPALWEIEVNRKTGIPSPRDYPGSQPLSEPESIAMAKLTNFHHFTRVNAFHTQGEKIHWGFKGSPTASEAIATEYARVSGYEAVKYVDNYAGYKDWFIQEYQRPGFTIELGSGINPLPISQFDKVYEESLGILLANLYL